MVATLFGTDIFHFKGEGFMMVQDIPETLSLSNFSVSSLSPLVFVVEYLEDSASTLQSFLCYPMTLLF